MNNNGRSLGKILRQRRSMIPLTLQRLSRVSGISSSYLTRIERGQRLPSASILRKLASPLDFSEVELLTLAGYLSPQPPTTGGRAARHISGQLDPYLTRVLSKEPIEIQHATIGILSILKSISSTPKEKKRMIKTVINCPDHMVMVFDKQGEQIYDYQGRYSEVKEKILRDAPPEAVFGKLSDFEPELRKVPKEEW